MFSFDPRFSYRPVIIRIREIEGKKKKKEKKREEYELDEASRARMCLVVYYIGNTNEEKREKENRACFSPIPLPLQPFHPPVILLFIYPPPLNATTIQNSHNLLFQIWVCRTDHEVCLGKPRINDNATTRTISIITDIEGGNFVTKVERDFIDFPWDGIRER